MTLAPLIGGLQLRPTHQRIALAKGVNLVPWLPKSTRYKFARMMKEMEQSLGATYRNICQPLIMTETPETLPNLEIPTIIPDMGVEHSKTDIETSNI